MTPSTTPRLSMKPLTATRSMRFVVALYSVTRIVLLLVFAPFCVDEAPFAVGMVDVPFVTGEGFEAVEAAEEFEDDETREKDLRTSGESSASTWRALRADEARRWVGKGVRMTLRSR